MLYECVIVVRQDVSPAHVEALSEQFAEIIKKNEGKVLKTEYSGLHTFAYLIKKNRKGHFLILNVEAPASAIQEFERLLKINEDVLRFLTTRISVLNEGPSALLKQSRSFSDLPARPHSSRPYREARTLNAPQEQPSS